MGKRLFLMVCMLLLVIVFGCGLGRGAQWTAEHIIKEKLEGEGYIERETFEIFDIEIKEEEENSFIVEVRVDMTNVFGRKERQPFLVIVHYCPDDGGYYWHSLFAVINRSYDRISPSYLQHFKILNGWPN